MGLIDGVGRAAAVAGEDGHVGVLVGGLAVSARAEPRFTRDADLVIAIAIDTDEEAEAEAVARMFLQRGYRLQARLEQSGVGRLSGARLVDPDGIEVDLIIASSGRETDLVDLRALAAVAGDDEWERAERAVSLITERGFHRGRALPVDLAALRAEHA